MKIGILTFNYSNNYGALLQTYALSTILSRLDFEPIVINRLPTQKEKKPGKIKFAIGQIKQKHFQKSFHQFRREFLYNTTQPIDSHENMKSIVEQFDAVVVGSDQVWRLDYTKGLGLNNFLDFVPDHIKKLSYAASFGKDEFDGDTETIIKVKELLARFNAISVREDSGVKICKEIFNLQAVHLLDPTLLLTPDDYSQIINKNRTYSDKPFLVHYLLDKTKQKTDIIEFIAQKMGLNLFNVYRESTSDYSIKSFDFNLKKYHYPSFSTWLHGIKNAELVITDSYHGAVFSILFNKQFICIANKERGITRMTSLLKKFGLEDRLISESDNMGFRHKLKKIDYIPVNQILNDERNKSIDFLKNLLHQ